MTSPLLRRCGHHSHAELVQVLRDFMRRCPEYRREPQSAPGTCQVCGHAIAGWRVFGIDESGPVDVALDSDMAATVLAWHSGALQQPEGVMVFAQHTCPEVQDEAIWNEARRGKAASQPEPTRHFSEPATEDGSFF